MLEQAKGPNGQWLEVEIGRREPAFEDLVRDEVTETNRFVAGTTYLDTTIDRLVEYIAEDRSGIPWQVVLGKEVIRPLLLRFTHEKEEMKLITDAALGL